MKLFKIFKVSEMSVPCAMIASGILSGLIIGLSVFLTTWIFFGGVNNRTKLFLNNAPRTSMPQNVMTQEQIKQAQAAAAAQQKLQQQQNAPAVNIEPATTTKK